MCELLFACSLDVLCRGVAQQGARGADGSCLFFAGVRRGLVADAPHSEFGDV